MCDDDGDGDGVDARKSMKWFSVNGNCLMVFVTEAKKKAGERKSLM